MQVFLTWKKIADEWPHIVVQTRAYLLYPFLFIRGHETYGMLQRIVKWQSKEKDSCNMVCEVIVAAVSFRIFFSFSTILIW